MKGFKYLIFLGAICLFSSLQLFGQACDLYFSEYVEGSSSNKYLEIYNGTGATINLSDYQIELFSNGSATPSITNTLSGTIANGAVVVYKNSSATIYAGAATVLSSVNFNGDDAVALYKISTATYVDIIGNIGCDPGTSWSSGSLSTKDHSLVRDADVCCGVNSDPANSPCDFPTLSSQWTGYPQDDVSMLGSYSSNCNCTPTTEPTINTSNATISTTDCQYSASISLTIGNGDKRIIVMSKNPISTLPSDQTHYTANSSYGSGSNIGSSEYVVFNGIGNSVTVTNLETNTTYYFAVFEYNGTTNNCDENYLTTNYFYDSLEINCSCPQIKVTLVNDCGTNNNEEGLNEYIKMNTEGTATNLDTMVIHTPDGKTFCNNGCGGQTIGNNPTYLASLNSTVGCTPDLFIYSSVVPPSSELMIFTGSPPTFNFDFSNIPCSAAPIYVAFLNNGGTAGHYANDANATRTTKIYFDASCTDSVTYYSDETNTGTNGDYVVYTDSGAASYLNNGNCIIPLAANSVTFRGKSLSQSIQLNWLIQNIKDIELVVLQKMNNDKHFEQLYVGRAKSKDAYIDPNPLFGNNYYKLTLYNPLGEVLKTQTIVVNYDKSGINIYPNPVKGGTQITISTYIKGQIKCSIYNMVGKEMSEFKSNSTISDGATRITKTIDLPAGIYFIQVQSGATTQTKKLIVY